MIRDVLPESNQITIGSHVGEFFADLLDQMVVVLAIGVYDSQSLGGPLEVVDRPRRRDDPVNAVKAFRVVKQTRDAV